LKEIRMADWKVLVILVLGLVCFALGMATLIVPLALTEEEHKWLWFAGLLLASICMGTLFTLYLKRVDRTFTGGR
jgi:hypothetical protein